MSEKTIEVIGYFGKPKQVTRDKFIKTWVDHAAQLSEIMMIGALLDNVRESAGNRFDEMYAIQNKKGADDAL